MKNKPAENIGPDEKLLTIDQIKSFSELERIKNLFVANSKMDLINEIFSYSESFGYVVRLYFTRRIEDPKYGVSIVSITKAIWRIENSNYKVVSFPPDSEWEAVRNI